MSSTFPVVRKGYDPSAVDAFVQSQAEAWRGQLEAAVDALEEWQTRANAMAERVAQLERRLRETHTAHDDQVAELESAAAELRWARDQARGELAEIQRGRDSASRDADSIIRGAREEAARILAAADDEAQRWFEAARRRIELAEAHAKVTPV